MNEIAEKRISSEICRTIRDGNVVYEKRYVTNDWDDDVDLILCRAKREVSLLAQMAESRGFTSRLGVVRVAAVNADEAMIATHEIKGVTLGDFIRMGTDRTTNLTPWFLAGRWLRKFQSMSLSVQKRLPTSKNDPADIVEYCDLRLRSLSDYGYRWPKPSIRNTLLRKIANLKDRSHKTDSVWVHADYSPGNLMWDGHALTPIDFAMARAGLPLDDATYLIHRIEMQRVYRPWLKLPVAAIRRAILRGLGVPKADQSADYQMLMIKHQICRLHTYVRRPASTFKQSIHDRWVRMVLKQRLQRATKPDLLTNNGNTL